MVNGTLTHNPQRTKPLTTFFNVQKSYSILQPRLHNDLSTGISIVKM